MKVLAVLALACALPAADFEWKKTIAAGKTVEIKGVNGQIVAESTSGGEVVVFAVKSGRRSNPADVRVEAVEHADGVTICAVYPSREGSPNECKPGKAGRMNTHNNDVKVDFHVRVPNGVKLVAKTVNGKIDATGTLTEVAARTVNGAIMIRGAGYAEAETVNGAIEAAVTGQPPRAMSLTTVNGAVTLSAPANANANVDASTVNGKLTFDLPLSVQGKVGRNQVQGKLGSGGPEIRLKTVNGPITLKPRA